MSDFSTIDYGRLREMAPQLGRPLDAMVAQSKQSDPFFAGLPIRAAGAKWLADLWRRLRIPRGSHVRRIYYILISQPEPIRLFAPVKGSWDYVNTVNCYTTLAHAVRDARYLGLIDFESITDQRNELTKVYYRPVAGDPEIDIEDEVGEQEFSLIAEARVNVSVGFPEPITELPRLSIQGPSVPQPVCVELWIEKSTMSDIVDPLCEQYECNFTAGTGEISATRCHELIERAREHGKPVRVLTITDFDPRGQNMPVAFARKLEFLIRAAAPDLDVQVKPIALTYEQCVEYRLPRDSDQGNGAMRAGIREAVRRRRDRT